MIALQPTKEGTVQFKIPSVNKLCFTYYKVFGELADRQKPALVLLHGGPGAGHEYLLPFAELFPQYGIPVVFYDQIGCGASTHLRETAGDKAFWQPELFFDELDNLLDHLELRTGHGYHLLGQSAGGRLVASYASRRPGGLQRLVIASGLASTDLAIKGTNILRKQLPPDVLQGLEEAERNRDFDSPAYKRAVAAARAGRDGPPPEELLPALKNLAEDNTVFGTMMGPSHLTITGSYLGWTCIPDLPSITAPTLVYNGEYDSSHDVATVPFFEMIPRVRWITFAGVGHFCHLGKNGIREKVLKIVGDFLVQHQSSAQQPQG